MYPEQRDVHIQLKRLRTASQSYLSDKDLSDLDTYAKRIRGEVLFARAWFFCEGQSEYLLLRYFAELLGRPLDQAGVTLIDFQNNGSPGAFVGLAQAFEIPWIMICDNDDEGKRFVKQVKDRGLTDKEIKELVRALPEEGADLEIFLVKNGFIKEYIEILSERKVSLTKKPDETGYEEEIASKIRTGKTGYTILLIEKLRAAGSNAARVPEFFAKAINDIIVKAG
ncbi:MAG TPA: TOPRIM nucleotidyl transferase/hydrolase domain-containing protein [Thermodesulfobacteriota bacterium]|nr:TOPRIM nucleotidyl transferase/hydrolase domain-containing protein [Thermodesulfobacteriota bacterium]